MMQTSFKDFFNKQNRSLLFIALVIHVVLLIAYKFCFPMPDFFDDSNSYVLAAKNNFEVYYRPIGYSHFLIWLHDMSSSPTFVVVVQYGLLVMSSLALFFSVDYLYGYPSVLIKRLAWVLLTVNPLLLLVGNQVASDSLFSALTIFWLTSLVWIVRKPKWWVLVLQVLLLYWAFQIRYNALYYPILALVGFLLAATKSRIFKLTGILLSCVVVYYSYNKIRETTERVTGADVFAGFSGWQLANNALFMYRHIEVDSNSFDDPDLKLLDQCTKFFYDSISKVTLAEIDKGRLTGSSFIWDPKSPLKQYVHYYARTHRVPYFQSWHQVSPLYAEYGKTLMLQHPGAFFRYYLLNNFGYYLCPDKEFLRAYNANNIGMADCTIEWFGYKDFHIKSNFPAIQPVLIAPYPIVHLVLVLIGFAAPVVLFFRMKKQTGVWLNDVNMLILLWLAYLCINMAFAVFASIVSIRYELPFFIFAFAMCPWFVGQLLPKKTIEK